MFSSGETVCLFGGAADDCKFQVSKPEICNVGENGAR